MFFNTKRLKTANVNRYTNEAEKHIYRTIGETEQQQYTKEGKYMVNTDYQYIIMVIQLKLSLFWVNFKTTLFLKYDGLNFTPVFVHFCQDLRNISEVTVLIP